MSVTQRVFLTAKRLVAGSRRRRWMSGSIAALALLWVGAEWYWFVSAFRRAGRVAIEHNFVADWSQLDIAAQEEGLASGWKRWAHLHTIGGTFRWLFPVGKQGRRVAVFELVVTGISTKEAERIESFMEAGHVGTRLGSMLLTTLEIDRPDVLARSKERLRSSFNDQVRELWALPLVTGRLLWKSVAVSVDSRRVEFSPREIEEVFGESFGVLVNDWRAFLKANEGRSQRDIFRSQVKLVAEGSLPASEPRLEKYQGTLAVALGLLRRLLDETRSRTRAPRRTDAYDVAREAVARELLSEIVESNRFTIDGLQLLRMHSIH